MVDTYDIAILANGAAPRHKTPLRILTEATVLICCDGAVSVAEAAGRKPDFAIGDGDSVAPADRLLLGERFVQVAEQDTNDLSKAFRFACSLHHAPPESLKIAVLGATGLREDHSIGNVFRLLEFTANVPHTAIFTDTGSFEAVRGERCFSCNSGEPVSVFAPVPGTAVSSLGLMWPLDGVSLADLWAGTLNRTTGRSFVLRTNGKPVLVYRPYADSH